jgi:hypothetical protein
MRLTSTKKGRLELQNYEFATLTSKGYARENYGDLAIFTMTDDTSTWLKIFRGTAAKEVIYKCYKTEAQAVEAITNAKASNDRNKAYKAELKANPKASSHSNCATAIREELKKLYPNYKFSVRSESFSGGDAVRVSWVDGFTVPQVDEITNKYAYGRFNSMEDLSYSVHNDDLPQAKYVTTYREFTDELKEAVKSELLRLRPDLDHHGYDNVNDNLHRILYNTEIPLNSAFIGLVPRDENDGYSREFYKMTFETPEIQPQAEAKEIPTFEKVEVKAGEVQIIDYSDKSIAVIGDTKPIKDQLKELGGKFNFRLSCGAGWIFQKSKLLEVQKLLSGGDIQEEAEEVKTTLKDEVEETINFLANLDVKIYGEVSESVKECARVQEVEIHHEAIQALSSNSQFELFL